MENLLKRQKSVQVHHICNKLKMINDKKKSQFALSIAKPDIP